MFHTFVAAGPVPQAPWMLTWMFLLVGQSSVPLTVLSARKQVSKMKPPARAMSLLQSRERVSVNFHGSKGGEKNKKKGRGWKKAVSRCVGKKRKGKSSGCLPVCPLGGGHGLAAPDGGAADPAHLDGRRRRRDDALGALAALAGEVVQAGRGISGLQAALSAQKRSPTVNLR